MVMLSDLLRYRLVDKEEKYSRPNDFVIDLRVNPYPPVMYILWRDASLEVRRTPWKMVERIDAHARQIVADDLAQARPVEPEWLEKAVLLKRDILDAMMIDLRTRSQVLANDVWLEEEDGQLALKGIDESFLAILRRLTRGRVNHSTGRRVEDWKYVEFLRGNLEAARSGLEYHGLIARLPAGEIAYLSGLLPYPYAAELVTTLPDEQAADAMEMMRPERQLEVFEEMDEDKQKRLLTLMRPDIAADLLSELEPAGARHQLEQIAKDQAERIMQLLRFPADTAGGLMTNDMVTLPAGTTVEQARAILVEQLKQPAYINFIQFVYVVDNEPGQHLQGFLSMRDLMVAEASRRLEEVMNPYIITIHPIEPAQTAAQRVLQSGLTALPVVNLEGRMEGVVTVDAALAQTQPKSGRTEILRLLT